ENSNSREHSNSNNSNTSSNNDHNNTSNSMSGSPGKQGTSSLPCDLELQLKAWKKDFEVRK
ncbi:unnamed protein product, partial [Polarella glacialis]